MVTPTFLNIIYLYTYIYIYTHIYTYIYMYIVRTTQAPLETAAQMNLLFNFLPKLYT